MLKTSTWLGRTMPKCRRSSVATVESPRRSATTIQPGVNAAQVLVGVALGQLGNARPICRCEVLDDHFTGGDRAVESGFGGPAELAVEQPSAPPPC
jgi:hypothetical protein